VDCGCRPGPVSGGVVVAEQGDRVPGAAEPVGVGGDHVAQQPAEHAGGTAERRFRRTDRSTCASRASRSAWHGRGS
jgi:hypothetical protein